MLRVSRVDERLDSRLTQGSPTQGSPAHGRPTHDRPTHGNPTPTSGVVIRTGLVRLIMMPPGTRGMPHFHADHKTALYIVSGETEVWHGEGLVRRSTVRAGDFLSIPPGAPHLAVNRGDVTSIAVTARTDPADSDSTVMIELPRHLAGLLSLPVAQD
jgi:uncharacterized RmlC-like cupin family protein